MSEEWVIEIETFNSAKEAEEWAKKYIKGNDGRTINAVSRDINIITL